MCCTHLTCIISVKGCTGIFSCHSFSDLKDKALVTEECTGIYSCHSLSDLKDKALVSEEKVHD